MKRSGLLFFSLLSLSLIFGACTLFKKHTPSTRGSKAPLVLVSLPPYQTIVEQIGGESVNVQCVLPPQVDPHSWEPTYKEVSNLAKAKLWFTVGEEFEETLIGKLKEVNPSLEVINLADSVKAGAIASEHGAEFPDTHYWLDPPLVISQANAVRAALTSFLPQHKLLYENRFVALRDYLTNLQETLAEKLLPFKGGLLVTTHGAFTYFCHEYGIEQLVIEPHEGKEPRTKDITRLSERLEKKKSEIVGIFLEPQHSNKATITLAQKLDMTTYMIDPYASDYVTTMQKLTDAITKHGLKESTPHTH